MKSKIKIYACGGVGTNISKAASKHEALSKVKPDIVYLDTSDSNLDESFEKDNVFIIPNVDGSGSKRDENIEVIVPVIPDVIEKHPAANVNVLVFSGGGGSGSVIGPFLAKALLEQGKPVIAVTVSTTNHARAVENSFKTQRTLENFAKLTKRPIPMVHIVQTQQSDRDIVNDAMVDEIIKVIMAVGVSNREVDSADIKNFLFYNNVTDVKPRLVHLRTVQGDQENDAKAISTLDILPNEDAKPNENSTLYRAVGFSSTDAKERITLYTTREEILSDTDKLEKMHRDMVNHVTGDSDVEDDDEVSEADAFVF